MDVATSPLLTQAANAMG